QPLEMHQATVSDVHAAVLLTPLVVSLHVEFQQASNISDLLSLAQLNIGSTQFGNTLVHGMTFLFPLERLLFRG
ncbi:MAG: hypothetical protein ABGZ35_08090, partial [Planctomycetaceae bacterium]